MDSVTNRIARKPRTEGEVRVSTSSMVFIGTLSHLTVDKLTVQTKGGPVTIAPCKIRRVIPVGL